MRLSLILLGGLAFAQAPNPAITLAGPATARPGETFTATVSANDTGAAALQWSIGFPTGYTILSVTPGIAANNKSITCTPSNAYCLLVGLNNEIIPPGQLASLVINVPTAAVGGPATIIMADLLGATPLGDPFPITAGPEYSLTIRIQEDVNGDGVVTAADVQVMTNQVIASKTDPSACRNDQNGDGKCDVIDVFRIVIKSLGLI